MKSRYNIHTRIHIKSIWLVLLVLAISTSGYSQSHSIVFYKTNLKGVLKKAKDENRYVFIDTYAIWCKPCKRMDKVFRNKNLATYFNNNFLNYKANMDVDRDKEFIKVEYSVVFLPTLIILDPSGNIVFKSDNEMSAEELLMAGKRAINPASYAVSQRPDDADNVILEKVENDSEGKIVKIMDKEDSLSANLLREEAYLRLELMDGSHKKAADVYLDTQKDWSTVSNMKFIMDFTEKVDSKQFDYIVQNRTLFDNQFGKDKVERLLNVVVYTRLQNGFPRATLKEAKGLYSKINVSDPYAYANNYLINRLFLDKENKKMIEVGRRYLTERPGDVTIAFKLASHIVDNNGLFSANDLDYARHIASDLLSHDDSNISYQKLLVRYYINSGECKKASDLSSNFVAETIDTKFKTELINLVKDCKNG